MGVESGTIRHQWQHVGMDWQRLAQAVIDRRVELGYRTRESFATETGLSSRLLGDLERGQRDNYDRVTISRLEKALQWEHGNVLAILRRGEEPDPTLYLLSRTRDRVNRLLDPDGPLDPKTRATLSALISNACDLVEKPPAAAEQLRDDEALEQFQATVAAHNERQRQATSMDAPMRSRRGDK